MARLIWIWCLRRTASNDLKMHGGGTWMWRVSLCATSTTSLPAKLQQTGKKTANPFPDYGLSGIISHTNDCVSWQGLFSREIRLCVGMDGFGAEKSVEIEPLKLSMLVQGKFDGQFFGR